MPLGTKLVITMRISYHEGLAMLSELQKKKIELRASVTINNIYSLAVRHGESESLYFNEITNELITFLQQPVFFSLFIDINKIKDSLPKLLLIAKSYKGKEEYYHVNHELADNNYCSEKFLLLKSSQRIMGLNIYMKVVRANYKEGSVKADTISISSEKALRNISDEYIRYCMQTIFNRYDNYIGLCESEKCWTIIIKSLMSGTSARKAMDMFSTKKVAQNSVQLNDNVTHFIIGRTKLKTNMSILEQNGLYITDKKWFEEAIPKAIKKPIEELQKSCSFIAKQHKINNLLLMARSYYPENIVRNKKYKSNIYPILTPSIKSEIRCFLSQLKEEEWKVKRFYDFKDEIDIHGKNRESLLRSLDDWFWESVRNNAGLEILNALAEPVTSCSESFTDVVFESAHCVINNAWAHSGLQRIRNNELRSGLLAHYQDATSRPLRKALKRAVSYHYILSAMAGDYSNNDNIHKEIELLMSPIELGGKIWAVLCHLCYVDKDTYSIFDEAYYSEKYHYLKTIRSSFSFNLRKSLQDVHLDEVQKIYEFVFQELINSPDLPLQDALQHLCLQEISVSNLLNISPYSVPIFLRDDEVRGFRRDDIKSESSHGKPQVKELMHIKRDDNVTPTVL